MDKKSFWIGILTLTAVVLFVANYFAPTTASASLTVKDRDYTMVTARVQPAGEALYVFDNRSGVVAVFTYDVSRKVMVLRKCRPVTDAFQK